MKQLKFRAWDGERMLYPQDAHQDAGSGTFVLLMDMEGKTSWNNPYGFHPEKTAHVEIMSFAGFKDKNGKDVYEGDIVTAYSAGSKANFQVKWRQEASPCYILFPAWQNKEFWHISATEHKKGKQFIGVDGVISESKEDGWYDEGLEVIGNIHQNPELIIK